MSFFFHRLARNSPHVTMAGHAMMRLRMITICRVSISLVDALIAVLTIYTSANRKNATAPTISRFHAMIVTIKRRRVGILCIKSARIVHRNP